MVSYMDGRCLLLLTLDAIVSQLLATSTLIDPEISKTTYNVLFSIIFYIE